MKEKETCQAGLYALRQVLQILPQSALAFSGGLDSRFLLHMMLKQEKKVLAVHVLGPQMNTRESEKALKWLKERDIPHLTVPFDPFSVPEVLKNSRERCYYCKLRLFAAIREAAPGLVILDGSNASDAREYRPGKRALTELGVISPLAEAGLSKPMIQALAAEEGLDRPTQPARPCLLTRFPYDFSPARELLHRVEAAENAVEDLGFRDFRLRAMPGKTLLQVSSLEGDLLEVKRTALLELLSKLGFEEISLTAGDSISGFYDYNDD